MSNTPRSGGAIERISIERAEWRVRGATLLRVENFELKAGEPTALVGPSGAGKTTLLRGLGLMLEPSEGSVAFDGSDPSTLSGRAVRELRTAIGFVYQDLSLVDNLTVLQNVALGRVGVRGFVSTARSMVLPTQAEQEAVYALLESLGIESKLFARVSELSGGEKQRAAVARTLYQTPGLLLADEPVSALDGATADVVLEALLSAAAANGAPVCMSLHDTRAARSRFARIVAVDGGRIVWDKPAAEVSEADLAALAGDDSEAVSRDR